VSFFDRIDACNTYDLNHFRSFYVENMRVGWVKHTFAEHLQSWPEIFQVRPSEVTLSAHLRSFEQRTEDVGEVIGELLRRRVIARRHGEMYPVTASSRDRALLLIDRASAPYFGLRAFGQHLNGYVRDEGEIKMWLGRRAQTKWNDPNKLDNMVAGGVPYGIGLHENLAKECWEEAAIPAELVERVIPTGAVTYCAETEKGLKPDVIYCYDLELPRDFMPRCTDGEVEEFVLWPLEKVAQTVRDTEEIKHNCNLVIIDFLIRHGFIAPTDEDYLKLVYSLRNRPMSYPY
jgi:8-oxo-dGTP pyrophosphatase MutT (NUDIX family)